MKRSVLIVVNGDPRSSARPAEAVRIAAGLSTNERLAVTLCLCGAAALAAGEYSVELMDGDHFIRYLPVLAEAGQPVLVQADSSDFGTDSSSVPVHLISKSELDEITASSERVLRY